jgi:putative transposase
VSIALNRYNRPGSFRFTDHLDVEQIAPSLGSVGDAYDNALMESIIGLYKAECIDTDVFHAGPYTSVGDVEYAHRRMG